MYISGTIPIVINYVTPTPESIQKIADALDLIVTYDEYNTVPCLYKKGCSSKHGFAFGAVGVNAGNGGCLYSNNNLINSGSSEGFVSQFKYKISTDKKSAIFGAATSTTVAPLFTFGYFEATSLSTGEKMIVYFNCNASKFNFVTEYGDTFAYSTPRNVNPNYNFISMAPLIIPGLDLYSDSVFLINKYKNTTYDYGNQEFSLNGVKYSTTSSGASNASILSLAICLD